MKKFLFFFSSALLAALAPMYAAAQQLPLAPNAPARAPGLYVQVIDGLINVSNKGGASNFSAGQFGYTPSFQQPPVYVPKNPGIPFTPPPSFSASSTSAGSNGGPSRSNTIDCEVR